MTLFARIDHNTGAPEARNLATEPPAAKGWVPLTIDPQPVPSASQYVRDAGIVVGPTQARQTWVLADKPTAQIDAETDAAELATLIANAAQFLDSGPPGTLAAAATDIQRLKRVCKLLLKQANKRGAV